MSEKANEHNYDRRTSDRVKNDSKVRQEIMEQMAEIEDPTYRVMLTIMLRLQDEMVTELTSTQLMMQGYMSRIAAQLEKISRTDEQIRREVLNGHSDVHNQHHHWIDNQMKMDAACGLVLNRHGEDGLCPVAKQAIEDQEVAKRRRWKVQDGIAEKAGLILIGIVAAALFPHLANYFQ
jgi:preprotein translocase subunit Sec63